MGVLRRKCRAFGALVAAGLRGVREPNSVSFRRHGLRTRLTRIESLFVRDITILVPAYNESRRIESTLQKILEYLPGHFEKSEVIVVDDGSSDGTGDLVESRFADRVRVIRRPKRGGKGAAIKSGVMAARGEWILFVDADLSIPIEEVEKLAAFGEKTPIVIGSKRAPGSEIEYPAIRHFLGGIGQTLISVFVVSGFEDTQCGFKLYRTDVAQELFEHQRIAGFGFDFEVLFLARRMGRGVSEVPVRCAHKIGGTVRLKTYLGVLEEVGVVWWNRLLGRYPKKR
jgi:dolichyl-phosphate beta-glucosyltransferase